VAAAPSSHAAAARRNRWQRALRDGAAVLLCAGSAVVGAADMRWTTVASGLDHPWSLAFLPDGRMLVTERRGAMRIVTPQGEIGAPLEGLPPVLARAQGGLLDVALDPGFADNHRVYWSYAEPGPERSSGTAVARGRLEGTRLVDVQVVFRQRPKVVGVAHYGGRLAFGRDGRLFVTLGDRLFHREQAQKLDSHLGKVVRIEADGRVPTDNPFVRTPGALPEIWSLGHRNVQGAALHPATGVLWTHEHGPEGGDEVNVTEAGRNYGWPVISYGVDYGTGKKIGEGTAKAGMEQPLARWVPSIAPSGMAFVAGERYPGWNGSLLVGALRGQALVRLTLDGTRVVAEDRMPAGAYGRIRDVRVAPDGAVYLLTDMSDGRIVRLDP
jgi:glucose/arabinose dehydrogenase